MTSRVGTLAASRSASRVGCAHPWDLVRLAPSRTRSTGRDWPEPSGPGVRRARGVHMRLRLRRVLHGPGWPSARRNAAAALARAPRAGLAEPSGPGVRRARGLPGERCCGPGARSTGRGWPEPSGPGVRRARGLPGECCCGPGVRSTGRAGRARGRAPRALHGAEGKAPGKGAAASRQRARGRAPRGLHGAEGKAPGKTPLPFPAGARKGTARTPR